MLSQNGVDIRKPGGTHVVFEHAGVSEALSAPAGRPIKPVYVSRFVQFIDAVRASMSEIDYRCTVRPLSEAEGGLEAKARCARRGRWVPSTMALHAPGPLIVELYKAFRVRIAASTAASCPDILA